MRLARYISQASIGNLLAITPNCTDVALLRLYTPNCSLITIPQTEDLRLIFVSDVK